MVAAGRRTGGACGRPMNSGRTSRSAADSGGLTRATLPERNVVRWSAAAGRVRTVEWAGASQGPGGTFYLGITGAISAGESSAALFS